MLTIVCLALLWLSCLFVPWELTEGAGHFPTIAHAPIFSPPAYGSWTRRQPSSALFYTWGVLAVSYAGLYALTREPKKEE
jgi:hypothetical protein